jgi:hypothetical protein
MAIDHQLEHKIRLAKKELEKSSPHIKWYVEYLSGVIDERDDKIKEYNYFFKTLGKFIDNIPKQQ